MKKRFMTFVLAGFLACQGSLGMAAEQSRASYEDAFRVISSAPSYVMITVVDTRTGQARQVCTTANFLLGAIDREYEPGPGGATAIALKAEGHVFRFQRQAALDNIRPGYTEAELRAAREFLAPLPTDELKDKFGSLFANRRLDTTGYKRDAIACVLIERGLSPKRADLSGQVYVER